jgi:hypothetical protein
MRFRGTAGGAGGGVRLVMEVDTGPNPLGACALARAADGGGQGFVLACPSPTSGEVQVLDLQMQRKPGGLNSAQAGGGAGPLRRPSDWLLGLEPTRARVGRPRAYFCWWANPKGCEQLRFLFKF